MEYTIILPENFHTTTVGDLLEKEWLVPRKVRHFLRMRKNVAVNGETVMFHSHVSAGDKLMLSFEETDYTIPTILLGDASMVDVLFEDEHLIIVNKPIGTKTHPNQLDENNTMLNHVAAYLAQKKQLPYVVHRLDQETSGAILFAKNPFVLPILNRLLEGKQIYRKYQAVVAGTIQEKQLTIRKKIGRDRHDRKKRIIDQKNGAIAVTHVEIVKHLPKNQTAIFCILETGRTHQIRVHLASIGHPIIGDPLYNPKSSAKRLFLHAYELHLVHPFSQKKISVSALPGIWE